MSKDSLADSIVKERAKREDTLVEKRAKRVESIFKERAKRSISYAHVLCPRLMPIDRLLSIFSVEFSYRL